MKESREEIIEAIQEADMKSTQFLMSFGSGMATFSQIADEALKEREYSFGSEFDSIFGGFGPEEEEEKEEDFSHFARRYAHKVRSAGTTEWLHALKKETAEMLINGLHMSGLCKITLGNGESFSDRELARAWEEEHGEKLCKKGNWDIF